MAKSKNVHRETEKTPWKRWKLWLTRNEKVLWVGLLLLVAPLFAFTGPVESFFRPTPDNTVQRVYFGEEVTLADLQRASRFVEALRRIAPSALAGAGELILSGRDFGFDPYKYHLYKEKAARLGIRVSDMELGQRIHELWRESEATRLASEEILASSDGTNQQQQMFQFYQLRTQKQKELADQGAFDSASWKATVERAGQLKLNVFEEMLRELFTVVKLQEYVASSVKVSPQEVYDEFKKDRQKRLLSWVTWTPPAELSEKISAAATEDDLEAYYKENKATFYKPLAVRASYVIVPRAHFEAAAEENLEDKDLEEYYSANKNEYRTSAILAEEALFALRTVEEQAEYEKALFKPLEEVKEEVREKVLESKATTEMNSFTNNVLRSKLFPAADSGATAPSLDELKAEYPYLTVGTTEYSTQGDAEESFGEAYTSEVNRWFRELDPPPNSPTPPKTEVTPRNWPQSVEAGKIFYTSVEVRPAYQPEYAEVAAEVREEYTKQKAVEAVAEALENRIEVDETAAEKPSAQDQLESLLASGIEVRIGEETLTVSAAPPGLVTATEYVRSYGSLRYVPPEDEAAAEEEKKDSGDGSDADADSSEDEVSEDDEDEGPKEEVHASSRQICEAGFALEEEGRLAVARNAGEDACYLVRFDDVIYPESSEFDTHKSYLETRLVREKQAIYLAEWHREVLLEASPQAAVELQAETETEEAPAEG